MTYHVVHNEKGDVLAFTKYRQIAMDMLVHKTLCSMKPSKLALTDLGYIVTEWDDQKVYDYINNWNEQHDEDDNKSSSRLSATDIANLKGNGYFGFGGVVDLKETTNVIGSDATITKPYRVKRS